jgi:LacI family transcriptional regulator
MSIVEVAKAAGVSTATVSRVLNDMPGVSIETIRQVEAAVEALNYKPLRALRSKIRAGATISRRTGVTGHLAVITLGESRDWLHLPVMASVLSGIQRAASQSNLRLILDELTDPLRPCDLVQNRKIDGAVVFVSSTIPARIYEQALYNLSSRVPIVWAMGMALASCVDHVAADNVSIGYLAHRYLIQKGCQEVAYVTADAGWMFMRLRGQAFLNAACDSGQPGTAYIVADESMADSSGRPIATAPNVRTLADSYGRRVVCAGSLDKLVATIAEAKPRPTGLFIANDRTTAHAYPLLTKYGLRVGHDLTVVSCDNEQVRLAGLDPKPATIDLGAEEIGALAVTRLRARLQRLEDRPLLIQVSPRLVPPD